MMTTHEVQTLLTIGENIVIEFKRAGDGPKWDTYESICAFLNRNGGDVLLGVTDDGKVVGLPPKGAGDMVKSIVKVMNDPNLWEPRITLFPEVLTVSGVRNLYHYVRIYSGADPVFDEGDIFRLTVPLDDDYSPEKGHLQKRQTIQAGVQKARQHGGFQESSDALRHTAVADNEPYNDTYKEPDNEPHNEETLTPSEGKFLSFVEQTGSLSAAELRTLMCVRNVSDFHARYIRPMLKRGLIEYTLPNAKRSKFQKYRLTRRGHAVVENVLRSRKEVNQ